MSVATSEHLVAGEVRGSDLDHGTPIESGIARRTTAEALELITLSETRTLSHNSWYEPERDFW